MPEKIITGLMISFLILLPFSAAANDTSQQKKTELTRELMVKSGLNYQVAHTPDALLAAVEENFKRAAMKADKNIDDITREIETAVTGSFKPDVIRSVIEAHIESKLDGSDIRAILKWLNSPLGRRITRLEEEASTAAAYREMQLSLPVLKESEDFDARIKIIRELDETMKSTESILEREMNMQLVYHEALSAAFPTMQLPSPEALRANFEIYKDAIKKRISMEITVNLLYTYRSLNLDEIKAYIGFIKTDYGNRYHNVVHDGMNKAFLYCGRKFGENIGKIIAKKSQSNFTKPDIHDYPQKQ